MANSRSIANSPDIEWNWDDSNYLPGWHEPIYELMARFVKPSSKILEVGAGGSHTIAALAGRLNCEAFGVEPDDGGIRKTLELAEAEASSVKMIKGDGFTLPFGSNQFDTVYSLGLIEHFAPGESKELIKEHWRVCRPGGTLIVAVPNLFNFPHSLRKALLGSRYEYFPERSYRPAVLRRIVEATGCQTKAVDGVSPLWGLSMFNRGWMLISLLRKLGVLERLEHMKSPKHRSLAGYMTYVIAEKTRY